jgi:hypothetical protein
VQGSAVIAYFIIVCFAVPATLLSSTSSFILPKASTIRNRRQETTVSTATSSSLDQVNAPSYLHHVLSTASRKSVKLCQDYKGTELSFARNLRIPLSLHNIRSRFPRINVHITIIVMEKVNSAEPSKDLIIEPLINVSTSCELDEPRYLRQEYLSYDPYFVSLMYLTHQSSSALTTLLL